MEISNDFFKYFNDEQLSTIATKVGCHGVPGGTNREFYINGIKSRYVRDFTKIIRWFEGENENILSNIKLYMLDIALQVENKANVEKVLINWGMYNGYSLETNITNILKEKYRDEFIKVGYHSDNCDKNPLYFEIVMFIYELSKVSLKESEYVIENFISKNTKIGNSLVNYLIAEKFIELDYRKKKVKDKVKVNEKKISDLLLKNNLLDFFKNYYNFFLAALGYSRWFDYILKIGTLQKINNTWINNDILKLVDSQYLKKMVQCRLVNEAGIGGKKFISLTALGLSINNNEMVEEWPGTAYRLEEKDIIFIAYNDNPQIVLSNLLNNDLICRKNLLEFILKT